jgi:hypothetical protein
MMRRAPAFRKQRVHRPTQSQTVEPMIPEWADRRIFLPEFNERRRYPSYWVVVPANAGTHTA